ncbi:hypothetical protein [Allokutzneria sp. NRRL B-24872]|uniref:hypothetical protein n=1 Tax=Allokutzneria sp. NRRL B-24872 TaxID=1137961 RepID=UPI000A3C08BD|nr:hypothetical protein [Allokutzneria sp. NRRL B-24872]
MKTGNKKRAAVLAGLVGIAGLIGSGIASAVPQPDAATGKYCVITLKKLQPGEATSKVTSRRCGDDPAAFARARSAETALAFLHEHDNMGGRWQMYAGDDGPCDASGYGIDWVGAIMHHKTSSILTNNWCNSLTLFQNSYRDPSAGWASISKPGELAPGWNSLPQFNDRTASFNIYRR